MKVLLAAGLMTLLDVLIEPVAVQLGFWTWHTRHHSAEQLPGLVWSFGGSICGYFICFLSKKRTHWRHCYCYCNFCFLV